MVVDEKCSLGRQQRPLESFNVTQHLPYVNLHNADSGRLFSIAISLLYLHFKYYNDLFTANQYRNTIESLPVQNCRV